jgi:hypothetical protein
MLFLTLPVWPVKISAAILEAGRDDAYDDSQLPCWWWGRLQRIYFRDMSKMLGSLRKTEAVPPMVVESPIGRTFILGLPDKQGTFRIFMGGQVWRIVPGAYQQGDRVHVIDIDDETLLVTAG